MKYNILLTVFVTLFTGSLSAQVLQPAQFRHYIDTFNADDEETVKQTYPNDKAWEFLSQNMPLLDYPDKDLERTYYFRWWTYRKHIKSTPDGFVVTEFHPNVPWAGKHNTISCPAAHHYREGRWLHHNDFLNDYSVFWLRKGGALRSYSFWIADSILQQAAVTGKTDLAKELLPDLIKNYEAWQKERLDPNGLFWQRGDRDGGEMSVATEILKDDAHYRAQINSYMFAEAAAISQIAGLAGDAAAAEKFAAEAQRIKNLLHKNLWDADARFYKVAPRVKSPDDKLTLVNVRELHGYTPWYFAELNPPEEYTAAWEQLLDPQGFYAPFGPTTAEQRHPLYKISYKGHECQWNGPSWPFATAITLTGLANLINRDAAAGKDVTKLKDAYQKTLNCYVQSHTLKRDDGKTVSWIDENINPATGDWIARTRLKTWKNGTWDAGKGGYERGKDYNHSTFCDLIISGLIGFRPVLGSNMVIYPLVPPDTAYFCLDAVKYHGHNITIFYDKDGSRYNRGKGFYVLDGGKEIVRLDTLPTKPLELSISRPAGQR